MMEFPNITRRVAAQRSRFMVFGTDPNWLAREVEKADAPLSVITISASAKNDMRVALRDAGITEFVIFPDLDGLGREIQQIWEDRR